MANVDDRVIAVLLDRIAPLTRESATPIAVRFAAAARVIDDVEGLRARVRAATPVARLALAILIARPRIPRAELVRAVALRYGSDGSLGAQLFDMTSEWPIFWEQSPRFEDGDEPVTVLAPFAEAIAPLLRDELVVPSAPSRLPILAMGIARTLIEVAVTAGTLLQRCPRVNLDGELNAAAASRLEKLLPTLRRDLQLWRRLGALGKVGSELGATLHVDAFAVRAALEDRRALALSLVARHGDSVLTALVEIAAEAELGHRLDLGAALLAIAMRSRERAESVPMLVRRAAGNGAALGSVDGLHIDVKNGTFAIAPDLWKLLRGELPVSQSGGFVQPDFAVILPHDAPVELAFLVAAMSELLHLESVARFRLTKESVLAARSAGFSAQDIQRTLERVAAPRPVPAAVAAAVDEWAAQYASATIETVFLLRLQGPPSLLDAAARDLAELVIFRASPESLLLSRAPDRGELDRLRQRGIHMSEATPRTAVNPRPETFGGGAADREAKPPRIQVVEALPPRNFSSELGHQRLARLVEDARVERRAAQARPHVSSSGNDDPMDATIQRAVDGLLRAWSLRRDWQNDFAQLARSEAFREALRRKPRDLERELTRATTPQQLRFTVAQLAAF